MKQDLDGIWRCCYDDEQTAREMVEKIYKIDLVDDVTFSFSSIGEISERDMYK